MKVIEQSYQILSFTKPQLIERAGRVAYKSEDKITDDSYKEFISMIAKRNHQAVLEHSMMSVLFITDRGISHELVRHRIASFTQESTRYCNYSKDKFDNGITFIKPDWYNSLYNNDQSDISFHWYNCMKQCEQVYLLLLEKGLSPQFARSVLPNSLKTEIVITTNFREWRHIFQLRAIEKAAHPQMRQLMIPLYKECRSILPEIFNLGEPE